jgi:hypothetical protein
VFGLVNQSVFERKLLIFLLKSNQTNKYTARVQLSLYIVKTEGVFDYQFGVKINLYVQYTCSDNNVNPCNSDITLFLFLSVIVHSMFMYFKKMITHDLTAML